ncbi:hypothetical protein H4219_004091 [Mycoemilia scoparia]|uniref:Bromo domain-containing protein n=1 Tax=Mycoemilia scoparia TaxID=417184 RepID=A0A9W7ZST2_9FUNG|nr:hypothetical protein H4219_004091 [Mycoemilia scoparia]
MLQGIKQLKGDEDELLCELFLELPNAKEYPDYYSVIKKPIALKNIQEKIRRAKYRTLESFMREVDIMVDNAKKYNLPDSYVCEAAEKIQKYVQDEVNSFNAGMVGEAAEIDLSSPFHPIRLVLEHKQSIQQQQSATSTALNSPNPATGGGGGGGGGGGRKRRAETATPTKKQQSPAPRGGGVGGTASPSPHPVATPVKRMRVKLKTPKTEQDQEEGPKHKKARNDNPTPEQIATVDKLFEAIINAEKHEAIRLAHSDDVDVTIYRPIPDDLLEGADDTDEPPTWLPLHAAAFYGRPRVIEAIIEAGADIEAKDTFHGSTAVSWGAYGGHRVGTRQLVKKWGARIDVQNKHGQYPFDLVPEDEAQKWQDFLDPNYQDTTGGGTGVVASGTVKSSTTITTTTTGGGGSSAKAPIRTAATKAAVAAALRARQTPSSGTTLPQQFQGQMIAGNLPTMTGPPTAQQSVVTPIPNGVSREIFNTALTEVLDKMVVAVDEDGNEISEPFMDLPDREEYPEYYEVIPFPMAFNTVREKIKSGYSTFGHFENDMMWIFHNAIFFNEEGSDIHNDALELERQYRDIRKKAIAKHGIVFDTNFADEKPSEGRFVPRTVWGDHGLFIGDFLFIKPPAEKQDRIAMITKIQVSGVQDRKKHIDGIWFMKPQELPNNLSQQLGFYPHEVIMGEAFKDMSARCITGKCFVLPMPQLARGYPKDCSPAYLYGCESRLDPATQNIRPITNWLDEIKVTPNNPMQLLAYPAPLQMTKLPVSQWGDFPPKPPVGSGGGAGGITGAPIPQQMQPTSWPQRPPQSWQPSMMPMVAASQQMLQQQQQQQMQQMQMQMSMQMTPRPMLPQQQQQQQQQQAIMNQMSPGTAIPMQLSPQQQRSQLVSNIQNTQQVMQMNQNLLNQYAAIPPNQLNHKQVEMIRQLQQKQWQLQQMLRMQQQQLQQQQVSQPMMSQTGQVLGQVSMNQPPYTPTQPQRINQAATSMQGINPMSPNFLQPQQQQGQFRPMMPSSPSPLPMMSPVGSGAANIRGYNTTNFYEQTQQLQHDLSNIKDDGQTTSMTSPSGLNARSGSIQQHHRATTPIGLRSPQQQQMQRPPTVASPLSRPPVTGPTVQSSAAFGQQPQFPNTMSTGGVSGGANVPSSGPGTATSTPIMAPAKAITPIDEQWSKMFRIFEETGEDHLMQYKLPPTVSPNQLQGSSVSEAGLRAGMLEHIQLALSDKSYFLHIPLSASRAIHSINIPISVSTMYLRPIFATLSLGPSVTGNGNSNANSPSLSGGVTTPAGGSSATSPSLLPQQQQQELQNGQQKYPPHVGIVTAKLNGNPIPHRQMIIGENMNGNIRTNNGYGNNQENDSQAAGATNGNHQSKDINDCIKSGDANGSSDSGKSVMWAKDVVFQLSLLQGLNLIEVVFKHPAGAMPIASHIAGGANLQQQQQAGQRGADGSMRQSFYCFFITRC